MKWFLIAGMSAIILLSARAYFVETRESEGKGSGENTFDKGEGMRNYNPPIGAVTEAEVYALSRTIQSEAPYPGAGQTGIPYTDAEREAIAATTRNHYYRHGLTIASGQGVPHPQRGSYASSAEPGNEHTDAIARTVLAPGYVDPTGGALSFFEPLVQDALFARGAFGTTKDSAALRRHWSGADGSDNRLSLYQTIGQWEFWGPASERNA